MGLHEQWIDALRADFVRSAELSSLDLRILELGLQGWGTKAIARHLRTTNASVNSRVQRLTIKLRVPTRRAAALRSLELGLICLHRNGTRIIKFFLHLSNEEQRLRLLQRIDDPDKNWKFSAADLEQREAWVKYQEAYEACLGATSTADAPWYAVPADDKQNAHLIISEIILDALRGLRMTYPRSDRARRRELREMRARLAK